MTIKMKHENSRDIYITGCFYEYQEKKIKSDITKVIQAKNNGQEGTSNALRMFRISYCI